MERRKTPNFTFSCASKLKVKLGVFIRSTLWGFLYAPPIFALKVKLGFFLRSTLRPPRFGFFFTLHPVCRDDCGGIPRIQQRAHRGRVVARSRSLCVATFLDWNRAVAGTNRHIGGCGLQGRPLGDVIFQPTSPHTPVPRGRTAPSVRGERPYRGTHGCHRNSSSNTGTLCPNS